MSAITYRFSAALSAALLILSILAVPASATHIAGLPHDPLDCVADPLACVGGVGDGLGDGLPDLGGGLGDPSAMASATRTRAAVCPTRLGGGLPDPGSAAVSRPDSVADCPALATVLFRAPAGRCARPSCRPPPSSCPPRSRPGRSPTPLRRTPARPPNASSSSPQTAAPRAPVTHRRGSGTSGKSTSSRGARSGRLGSRRNPGRWPPPAFSARAPRLLRPRARPSAPGWRRSPAGSSTGSPSSTGGRCSFSPAWRRSSHSTRCASGSGRCGPRAAR